ncbi:hypothetical protein [Legionella lansingensis]|uniref:hypothetical protein n=1 Tax=Legionella lansingensis TaxID=45067 RepID=UPI0012FD0C88|nr:hypothetical protein [Legionella lansingensis]
MGDFNFKAEDFNLNQLDSEFSSLYQLFISNKKRWENDRNNDVIYYMETLCDLMISYYKLNYVRAKLEDLQKKKNEIAAFRKADSSKDKANNKPTTVPSFLRSKLASGLSEVSGSFSSSAQLRSNISLLNSYRIYWIYCRGLVKEMVAFLEANGFSDYLTQLNTQMGLDYSASDFLKLLEKPQQTLYVLSVGIYALRFMINLVTMTRHILEAELEDKLSSDQVFTDEMEKRGFSMLNDGVWGTVNLLTNYNKQFNISDVAAANATVVFLVFDAALLMAQWLFESTKYKQRVQELGQQKRSLSPESNPTQYAVVQRQLDILNDEWEAQCAYYAINIMAASLVAIGFGATVFFSGGLSLAVLSMIGNALYATADEYKNYKKSTIAIQREKNNGHIENDDTHLELMSQLTKESSQAYSDFWKRLAYNTAGPAFIITTAAFSWPIALLITVPYVVYQVNSAYKKSVSETNQADTHGIYRLFDKPKSLSSDEAHKTLLLSSNSNQVLS